MNIFQKVTRKNLKENRTRTLVTIIGILLSAAMFTAVTVSISSLRQYLISHAIYTDGSWHGALFNLTEDETKEITEDSQVSDAVLMKRIGFAELENSQNSYKPYLCVYSVTENFTDLMPIHLTSGRLPKNNSEILLPEHLNTNGGIVYDLDDTISLALGKRTDSTGHELDNHAEYYTDEDGTGTEEITDTTPYTYTVVGFYERPTFEAYSAPGYTALTISDTTANGFYDIYFCTNEITDAFSYLDTTITHFDETSGTLNNSLLRLYTSSGERTYNAVVYSLGTILICIIAFGSISLIYNAFSISVSERTKQFGLLSSIGATKQQLTSSILYEAFCLSMIGIPLGILCGIIGIGITFHFTGDIIAKYLYADSGVTLSLHASVPALLIAVLVSLITILISAWLPARRATKCSAIQAIRQNKDITILPGKVKTSKLTQKLFGFEGVLATKNYKRNRKKYRATVISLFLSIVLFISASSFCAYLAKSTDSVFNDYGYDISYSLSKDECSKLNTLIEELSDVSGITSASYKCNIWFSGTVNSSSLTQDYKDYAQLNCMTSDISYSEKERTLFNIELHFIEDDAFRDYLNSHNLSEDDYFNSEQPTAIALNTMHAYNSQDSRYYTFPIFSTVENSDIIVYLQREKDGYEDYGYSLNENGEIVASYRYDTEDSEDGWLDLPAEECSLMLPLHVGTAVEDLPEMTDFSYDYINLVYPYSMVDYVFSDLEDGVVYRGLPEERPLSTHLWTSLTFCCEDHMQAMANISKILSNHGLPTDALTDYAADQEQERAIITVVNIFSYGFITLISLIAAANVFNTISTNMNLRKREFAMLKSIGMTPDGFQKMLNFECLLYGFKGLLYGLPVSILVTWCIYRSVSNGLDMSFFIPWYSIVIAVGSVFVVVFATMLYSTRKIKKENIMDTLKNENI